MKPEFKDQNLNSRHVLFKLSQFQAKCAQMLDHDLMHVCCTLIALFKMPYLAIKKNNNS